MRHFPHSPRDCSHRHTSGSLANLPSHRVTISRVPGFCGHVMDLLIHSMHSSPALLPSCPGRQEERERSRPPHHLPQSQHTNTTPALCCPGKSLHSLVSSPSSCGQAAHRWSCLFSPSRREAPRPCQSLICPFSLATASECLRTDGIGQTRVIDHR